MFAICYGMMHAVRIIDFEGVAMKLSNTAVVTMCGTLAVIMSIPTSAQTYPTRAIRIVTAEAGGGPDLVSRFIAAGLTTALGQQVVVDNRASGVIPGDLVSKAPPDGYTLLVTSGILWIIPFLQTTPFDPIKDFTPITLTNRSPNILVVHPSLPVRNVKELIALAKSKPGQLNYGTAAIGSPNHLAAELFKSMANVNIVGVPYKGTAPALNDLIAGQVQMVFATTASGMGHVKSGRLKALAITTLQRSALAPDLVTVSESGLPGYESVSVYCVLAPAKISETLVTRLNQEVVRVLNQADVKEKFFKAGVETIGSTPDQLAAAMKSEMTRMGKVIRDAHIHAE